MEAAASNQIYSQAYDRGVSTVMTNDTQNLDRLRNRKAPLELSNQKFRNIGHQLVDRIADFLEAMPRGPVTPAESPETVRAAFHSDREIPETGADAGELVNTAANLLFRHSLFNGHPRFFGYITSSAAPIGAFADLLASAVNPNVGAWKLAPLATEIEAQTIRWIAEFMGYPSGCGGLLVSGGNMANFVGFLAGRTHVAEWDLRKTGLTSPSARPMTCYASKETHTWVQKAADLFGLGTNAIRWIPVDHRQRMDTAALQEQIRQDREQGYLPFAVIGTAGSVSTGAVDPLKELAAICRNNNLWFHVDGAYGGVAASIPGAPEDLIGLSEANSIAIDPHKWLYAPLEAGCILVRDPRDLRNTFSYQPSYYNFDIEAINYFDYGPQNSRAFRALKVWLALQQVGSAGYRQMIADDMRLSRHLRDVLDIHPEFETFTQNLSITTFRYVPESLRDGIGTPEGETTLDRLNQELLNRLEKSGEAFLSNAIVDGKYALRACIVNFRTSLDDIEALPHLVSRVARELVEEMDVTPISQ
jgi:aromatic-L-amino-acid decarboxylase